MDLSDWFPLRGYWVIPFWGGAFVLGLLLLAPGPLPSVVERWTIPSLAIYLVGVVNVIFWKELHHARYRNEHGESEGAILPTGWIRFYLFLQAVLLAGFLWYNWWRGVI